MSQAGFRSEVVIKQAAPMRDYKDPTFAGYKKLAAEVIKYAISDYHESLEALRATRKSPLLFTREYKELHARRRNETRGFLTDDTLFHQILDLDPAYFARLIDEGTLPVVEWRADQRKDK